MTEDREFGMRKSECGSWKTQTGDGRQKAEIRKQMTDDRRQGCLNSEFGMGK
jgi:hypothetical protein